jgi:O-antigen ligase
VYLFAIRFLFFHYKKILALLSQSPLLIIMTLYACFSVLWSNQPAASFASARILILETVIAVYLALNYNLRQQLKLLAWALGIVTVLSLLVVIIPSYSFNGPDFQGIFRHKNRLSGAMAMTILLFANHYLFGRDFRKFALPMIVLAFIALILSAGKGSLVNLFACCTLLPLYYAVIQKNNRNRVFRFIIWLYSCVFLGLLFLLCAEQVADLMGKDLTLTGRTDLWAYLMQRVMERPLLGFGLGGFWTDPNEGLGVYFANRWFTSAINPGGGNAHNGYIQILLELGFVGAVLVSLSCISLLFKSVKMLILTRRFEFLWVLQFLLYLIISNNSETNDAWFNFRCLSYLLYMSTMLSVASFANKNRPLHQIF